MYDKCLRTRTRFFVIVVDTCCATAPSTHCHIVVCIYTIYSISAEQKYIAPFSLFVWGHLRNEKESLGENMRLI